MGLQKTISLGIQETDPSKTRLRILFCSVFSILAFVHAEPQGQALAAPIKTDHPTSDTPPQPSNNEAALAASDGTAAETDSTRNETQSKLQAQNPADHPPAPETPSQGRSESSQPEDTYFGPTHPIGHSLTSPEARERITALMSMKAKKAVSNSPVDVDEKLPPLVGGSYGFPQPEELAGGVPKAIIQLGAAGPRNALIVEKLHHRLSIFQSEGDGPLQLLKTFRAITGKDPGDKTERGDFRTPEGVYFVVGRINDRVLPPKYGRLALTLDYPNVFDKKQNKSGYGIWLHATDDPKRLLKPFDTEGCIAVSNEDIMEIERYIKPGVTPIIITKEMTSIEPEKMATPKQQVTKMLESWRQAWKHSKIDAYMNYYSDSFRQNNMGKNEWKAFKSRIAEARADIDVKLSEPTIVATEDQLIISFLQEYLSDGHSDFGIKSLYLRWENDQYRIIAENWRPVQKTETALQELQNNSGQL